MIRGGAILILFTLLVYCGVGMFFHYLFIGDVVYWNSALSLGVIFGWMPLLGLGITLVVFVIIGIIIAYEEFKYG